MPAALEVDWSEVKLFCVSGHSYKEASAQYGIDEATIRQRSHREQWPIPERVSQLVTRVAENQELAQKMAVTWAEKGEEHRALAFRKAHEALKSAPTPEIKDWADMERADKMARRASGLDDGDSKGGNSLTLNLIQQRMDIPTAVSGEYIQAEAQEIPQEPE